MKQQRMNLQVALVLAVPAVLFGGSLLGGCGGASSGGNGLPTPTPGPTATPGPTPTPVPVQPTIAFSSNQGGNIDIFLTKPTGGAPQRLTTGPGNEIDPDVTRDAKMLVFASNSSGNFEIYTRTIADNLSMALTNDTGATKPIDDSPVWSFNGGKIAWRSTRDGKSNIWTMNASGSDQQKVTSETVSGRDPAWSPDGTRLAYIASRAAVDTIVIRTLSSGAEQVLAGGSAIKSHPRFSPDGTRLVFTQGAAPGAVGAQLEFVTVAGGAFSNGPSAGTSNFDPNWSPDGTHVIWVASGGATATAQIFTAKPDGTDQKQVTSTGINSDPSWAG